MGRKKESPRSHEHSTAKRAAIISGAGLLGVAAAIGTAKVIHHKRKSSDPQISRKNRLNEISAFGTTPEEQQAIARAELFDNPDLSQRERELLGKAAVLTHLATFDTAGKIAASSIRSALGQEVSETEFTDTIDRLVTHELITPDPAEANTEDRFAVSYVATPALARAVLDGEYQAVADAWYELVQGGGWA